MNKPKATGTLAETAVVKVLRAAGLDAHRPALAGRADVGDVWIDNGRIVIEVKSRKVHASPRQVEAWMAELERECMNVPVCDVGVLVVKRPGSGPANAGDWDAYLRLDEFTPLVGAHSPSSIADAHRVVRVTLADLVAVLT